MIREFLRSLVPDPAGALWLGLLTAFMVFGDSAKWSGPRNRSLLALLAMSPLLARIFGFSDAPRALALVFTLVFLLTAAYAAWGARLALRPQVTVWKPNLGRASLRVLVAFLIVLNAVVVFGRAPDDAGIFTNLGAQRWRETGILPYADPLLKGPDAPAYGAAATYGPVLYAVHVPFQRLLLAPRNPPDANPKNPGYRWPPVLATQLACFAFYVMGLASLFAIVRRVAGPDVALGAVALYASSPYVLGLGGSQYVITGLAYVSHIAPSALMLAALAVLDRPIISGALLAAAAGALFYPAFVFPLWFGWLLVNRMGALRFAAGFAITAAIIALVVMWFVRAPDARTAVSLVVESTLEHQEGLGPRAYGASSFSFWGTHPGLAAVWQRPLLGQTSLFKPTFVAYSFLVVSAFFLSWTRPRSIAQLSGFTAMLTAAVQLWKTHATGSYVEWYYPFLLVALLAVPAAASGRLTGRVDSPGS